MNTSAPVYLFAWNPQRFDWSTLDDDIRQLQRTGSYTTSWSCGSVKHIPVGSRFFLIRLGQEPRGIVGSGRTSREVYQKPHYDATRAAAGDVVNSVDVTFDVLARTPLIRRAELDAPEFEPFGWDTQMSGVRIPAEAATELETLWRQRVADRRAGAAIAPLPKSSVERWRILWENARASQSWLERDHIRDEKRREVLPAMRELLNGFLGGEISLAQFRETFDRKTRNDWDFFGLKGTSGAMFLNKLAKNLPDQDATATVLRAVLQVPPDDDVARRRLSAFMSHLERQISTGIATSADLQVNRSPFFVSACWHIQQMDAWPIMFESARTAFKMEGLLGTNVKGADGYLEFAHLFRALAEDLGVSFWDLEHLCHHVAANGPGPVDPPRDPREPRPERDRVWLVAPGPRASFFDQFFAEGIIAIGWGFLGDLTQYEDLSAFREAIHAHQGGDVSPVHDALACYQFFNDIEVGDVVIAKLGRSKIVGYGVVTSGYRYEPSRGEYPHVRSVQWKLRGDWTLDGRPLVTKTLTDIGKYPALVEDIWRVMGIQGPETAPEPTERPAVRYSIDDIAGDMFLPRQQILEALELLRYKKNIIVQGPPGVGKTFFAKRLAYLLLGERDAARVSQVQFHQSYSYEDFIQGYRPTEQGTFRRTDGPFMRFCAQALQDTTSDYVFIIDEINRGNLSKIFGELMMLIESDKRDEGSAIVLTYAKEHEPRFYVPDNVHIIGTMNTADRSLAVVDYALRRRFAFFDLRPGFEHESFATLLSGLGASADLRHRVISRIDRLNAEIREDASLGDGFCIGHSYFCHVGEGQKADGGWFRRIVRTEIAPLLREYWYDNKSRAEEHIGRLLSD